MEKFKELVRKFLMTLLVAGLCTGSFFLGTFYEKIQSDKEITKLQSENNLLKQLPQPSSSPQPTPSASPIPTESPSTTPSISPTQVDFDDIKGGFGEKEISQLAQLGVFDTTTNKFKPQQPITRGEFIRWLVRANNAIWADKPDKIIPLAKGRTVTFTDVPPTYPDFRYIQGMVNAGFPIGYEQNTFKPNELLTREQMISIKVGLDAGRIQPTSAQLPPWTDKAQISHQFLPSIEAEYESSNRQIQNIERTFGAIISFQPQASVTRAQAAVCIFAIGDHTPDGHRFASHFRTAQQVIQAQLKEAASAP